MSKMMRADVARKEIIRAGATYPSAVPSSYFEPTGNPHSGGRCEERDVSNRNIRPRPAFGATRDEGAVGPIKALSPYAEAVDCSRRNRGATGANLKPNSAVLGAAPEAPRRQFEIIAKGPTADEMISMTAAGKRPPVREEGRLERREESLSKISVNLATAVSQRFRERNEMVEAVSSDERNNRILSEKIPGYRHTWGVAFSQEAFAQSVHPPEPDRAESPDDYLPRGVIQ